MTAHVAPTPAADSVLCWIFRRHAFALTCELDLRADRSYDVVLVPHWDVSLSAAEHFDALPDALLRHAQIASQLRETGWSVTDHVDPHHAPLAA